jgi:hypothetical protein
VHAFFLSSFRSLLRSNNHWFQNATSTPQSGPGHPLPPPGRQELEAATRRVATLARHEILCLTSGTVLICRGRQWSPWEREKSDWRPVQIEMMVLIWSDEFKNWHYPPFHAVRHVMVSPDISDRCLSGHQATSSCNQRHSHLAGLPFKIPLTVHSHIGPFRSLSAMDFQSLTRSLGACSLLPSHACWRSMRLKMPLPSPSRCVLGRFYFFVLH